MTGVGSTATQRLDGIESLRAYAAVAIVLFHVIWIGKAEPIPGLEFIKWYGGLGVQLFFVVSAFSLSYGYWGRLGSERDVVGYFVRRFARIAPLYYVIFLLQLILLYATVGIPYSLLDIALCVLFVFNFVPRLVDGIVPASWSIGVEMAFYVLLPLALLLCRRWWMAGLLLVVAAVVGLRFENDLASAPALRPYAAHSLVSQLPFFCWGLVAYHGYRSVTAHPFVQRHRRGMSWTLVAASVAMMASLIGIPALNHFLAGLQMTPIWIALWGAPFALLCIGMAIHPTRFVSNAVTRYLGKVSYSLYLVHPNIVILLMRGGVYRRIYEALPGLELVAFLASAALSLGIVAALSAFFFRFVETPGMAWGKRVASAA